MSIADWWRQKRATQKRRREYQARLRQGVEEIVDRVDPRLRGVMGYRSTLLPVLEQAVVTTDRLIAALPPPLPLSRAAWSADPQLHAYFASVDDMQQLFDGNEDLGRFLASAQASGASEVFAAMGMRLTRRTTLQTALHGEILEREQQRVSVSFSDHRLGAFAADEQRFRTALRRRVLEEVAVRAMQKILGARTRREALEEERSKLLWKQKIYRMRSEGVGPLWRDQQTLTRHIDELTRQVGEVQHGLDDLLQQAGNIEQFLQVTATEFASIEQTIRLEPIDLSLDAMNLEANSEQGGRPFTCWQLRIGRRAPRVLQLLRFPADFAVVDTDKALRRAARALGVR